MLPNSWFPEDVIIYAIEDDMKSWKLIEVLIVREINKYRIENGLKPVSGELNTKLETKIRSDFMSDEEKLSHDGFGVSSRRLKDMGFKSVGEIIAYGYTNGGDVVHAWKNSPSHNRVLLGNYKYLGVSKTDRYYCVIFTR